jgi:WG containing repeat
MKKMCVCRSLLLLLCTAALAHTVYTLPRGRQRPERLYRVVNNENKIGFIDQTGKLVIGFDRLPKATIAVRDFHEGRAAIYLKKEKRDEIKGNMDYTVGYIDATGEVIIAPRFVEAYDFSEGLAYVEAEGERAFINRHGKVVFRLGGKTQPSLEGFASGFHEGLAVVYEQSEAGIFEAGFIDRSGKLVFKGYTSAASFSEGLAAVAVERGRDARYGFVNKRGEMIIKPRFSPVLSHHDQIQSLSRFSEGLASVRVGNVYGYIDKKGDFRIAPQFLFADDFSEGLACARLKDKTGYIDESGRWVIGPWNLPYMGGRFKEGLAPVPFSEGGGIGWRYIDRTGKVIIRTGDHAYEFVDGVAAVYSIRPSSLPQESGWGYINKAGKYLWRPQ